jgi:hypothetical protein
MAVPYTFATATTSIPLSQLDSNFATAITLGNTSTYLGNTTTSIGNLTLTNATISSGNVTISSISDSGNLTFTGTGNRITGDFTNATFANRVAFQTSSANTATTVLALPSGSGTTASWDAYNNSDPTNSGYLGLSGLSTETRISSSIRGTGTYLPMTFFTGGSERVRIDTSGNTFIGASSGIWDEKLGIRTATGAGAVGIGIYSASSTYASSMVRVQAETSGTGWKMFDGRATGGTQLFYVDGTGGGYFAGNTGIGTTSPSASAILDAQSTTKGVRMPNMTTTQKNAISSPAAGLMVFDTTLAKLCVYSGAAWQTITSV